MKEKQGKVLVETDTFKIRRSGDKKCWIYEEWRTGGVNQTTGQPSPGLWYPVGYYGKLEDLAIYLLNRQIEVPESTGQQQIVDLRAEVKAAEERIAEALKASALNPEP